MRCWGREALPHELPRLRFLSDILWFHWSEDNPRVKDLRHYMGECVINEEAVWLVARAFHNIGSFELNTWPGKIFSAESDEGKALIGKSSDQH